MDTIIACRYKGGCIIAADSAQARSILIYKDDLDKIAQIGDKIIMGSAGPNADTVSFSEYISKNLSLYQLNNDGRSMSTKAAANFIRGELATALRKGPYQTNVMIGGYDKGVGSTLYYCDYMGTLQQVNFGVQGYASSFTLSIFDREWREGMTRDEAFEVIRHCVEELNVRFLVDQRKFFIKSVDESGVQTISTGELPPKN